MAKVPDSISKHREQDLKKVRRKLLSIIDNPDSQAKNVVDASKLLARMHHSLQPDKVTSKLPPEEKREPKQLTKKELQEVQDFIQS